MHWLVSISLMAPSNKRRPNNPFAHSSTHLLKLQQRCTMLLKIAFWFIRRQVASAENCFKKQNKKPFSTLRSAKSYSFVCGHFQSTDFDEMLTNKRELFAKQLSCNFVVISWPSALVCVRTIIVDVRWQHIRDLD